MPPHFVNNDYVTADIIYSTVHTHHKVVAWSWVIVCSAPESAPLEKSGGITAVTNRMRRNTTGIVDRISNW